MEVRPEVYTYGVEWDRGEPLGVHVIETDEATVLFGAGTDDAADVLVTIARDHGVDTVVVEHGDGDHYGGVPALRDGIDGLEVATPAGDVSFLENAGIEVDRPLAGETVYRGIRTIPAPGHTPDNMAYLYEDVLVAGDTVLGVDSQFATAGDWSGAFAVSGSNTDDERTRDSVSVLAEYDFDIVLVTHGPNVTEGGRAEVETLIADLASEPSG